MTVKRNVCGKVDEKEVLNQSALYVTTAGYKNTFSYEKLIQILCQMVARKGSSIVLGGSWRQGVMEGTLAADFVDQLKLDGTFNEASFDREFESKWTGEVDSSFFSAEVIDKFRDVREFEDKETVRHGMEGRTYYVMGVDVGRRGCTTEIAVLKVTVSSGRPPVQTKKLVNIYTFDEEHFGLQAIKIKRIYNRFHPRMCVVDANGLGIGLVDYLVTDQEDPDTGEMLWNWGCANDDEGFYKKFRTPQTIQNAFYAMKANRGINTECYSYTQSQLLGGKLHFLIDEAEAKASIGRKFMQMTQAERSECLLPYTRTSILRDQMLNLMESNEGSDIVLTANNTTIKHDKFSALIYAMYWCKKTEEGRRRASMRDMSQFLLCS